MSCPIVPFRSETHFLLRRLNERSYAVFWLFPSLRMINRGVKECQDELKITKGGFNCRRDAQENGSRFVIYRGLRMVLKEPEAKFEDIAASILISRTYMGKKSRVG